MLNYLRFGKKRVRSNKSQTIASKLHLANKINELLSATIRAIDHKAFGSNRIPSTLYCQKPIHSKINKKADMQFGSVDMFMEFGDWNYRMGRPVANEGFLQWILDQPSDYD